MKQTPKILLCGSHYDPNTEIKNDIIFKMKNTNISPKQYSVFNSLISKVFSFVM